ncbi:hypothetical protein OC610_06550 [Pseudomonas sp. SAICEU22]|uniref:Uncharacterized protein n=1 Tax=Pseudomonas agronomica TaxID=2979328 RepID=A0ABT3F4P1_9PSED|nr:hypothetical protein [Pseudomonas agronomica]MCW1244061.1 hypothetical protein [Pseudomonas agronomica]
MKFASVVSVFLLTGLPTAHAYDQEISARFRPDSSTPHQNTFLNTTPVSGYCRVYPSECSNAGMFSIRVPVSFDSSSPISANHDDPRQGAMFNVPAGWRTAQVVHSTTGETEVVEVRFIGVGSTYRLHDSVFDLIGVGAGTGFINAHGTRWGTSWQQVPAPCQAFRSAQASAHTFQFFWKTPTPGVCAKRARYAIPRLTYDYLDFGYEMRTPNPMGMSSGRYTGRLVFLVGPGADIDMGDVMIPGDPVLAFNFILTVEHTLKVEIPPGGNRVELAPQEGWQAWVNNGQRPTRLFRDQRFDISASSRFKMALECQTISGNTCAITEVGTGHAVPVDVSVTLPNGMVDAIAQPIIRRPLLRDGSGTALIWPFSYIDRKPGTLHFEVGRESVEAMLDNGGNTYTGNVTVIWDSEV